MSRLKFFLMPLVFAIGLLLGRVSRDARPVDLSGARALQITQESDSDLRPTGRLLVGIWMTDGQVVYVPLGHDATEIFRRGDVTPTQ